MCVCARTENLTLTTLVPSHLTSTIYIIHLNFHYVPWKDVIIDFHPFRAAFSFIPHLHKRKERRAKSPHFLCWSRLVCLVSRLLVCYTLNQKLNV